MYTFISLVSVLLLGPLSTQAYSVVECYWGPKLQLAYDLKTHNGYIPCGEAEVSIQSCCRVGHTCLEANACYAPEAGTVYTAGCTDMNYTSSQCPAKCGFAAYWIGHSYCNGTSNQWSCCPNHYGGPDNKLDYPVNNQQPCWCPENDAMVDFTAPSVIPSVAYLDLAQPGKISYFPGHEPSTTVGDFPTTSTSTTRQSQTGSDTTSAGTGQDSSSQPSSSPNKNSPATNIASQTTNSPSQASASDSSNTSAPVSQPSSSGLSTGAKVGIGVGAGLGSIILAVLSFALLRLLRKRKQSKAPSPSSAPIEDQIRPKSYGSSFPASPSDAQSPEGANGDLRSPAWSGHKSELPADESAVASSARDSTAEVEGTTPRNSVLSQQQLARQSGVSQLSQPIFDAHGIRQYRPFNPRLGQSLEGIHEMPG